MPPTTGRLALTLVLLMLTAPLGAASVAVWTGPNAVASTGQNVTVDGFEVPGNSTILNGWVLIGSDAMPGRGNGQIVGAGLAANFTQGTHDATETDAFSGPLSLSIDSAAQQVDTFAGEAVLSFATGLIPGGSNSSLWQPSLISQINGTTVGNSTVVPHGTIPAAAADGSIVAATAPGAPVPPGTDAWLEMGNLRIPHPVNNLTFEFEHWYHLGGAGDGVWLEYSLDNGSWNWVEPVSGYDANMTSPPTVNGTGGGVPVWQNTTASGWRHAEFLFDNITGIDNASDINIRFRIATASSGSTPRPGWFVDALDVNNQGNTSAMWHHGCHVSTGTCGYSNNAESALQTTLNLSQAGNNSTLKTRLEWDLEGSMWDNFCVELSLNNNTWSDISSSSNSTVTACRSRAGAIPGNGYTIRNTTYGDETNAFVDLVLDIPAAFQNQSTVHLRYHVQTDSSVTGGGTMDDREGVSIDDIKVLNGTNQTIWHDPLTSATSMFHYSINAAADDWMRTNVGAGQFTVQYGFEDSPAQQPSQWPAGWSTSTSTGTDGWEYGAANWLSGGPTSFTSAPFGFGMNLDGNYMASAWEHLFTPAYQVPAGARVRFTFDHWMCSESGWDSGALYISTNNNSWAHVNPGTGFYDGAAGFGANNLAGLEVWDGRNSVSPGGFSCSGPHNLWDSKQVDLSQYNGQTVWFRFSFESDAIIERDGWYIDDVGLEVDQFVDSGTWESAAIPVESLGNGFLDIDATVPENTSVTATVTTSNGVAIGGMTNRSLPLSLAGIDRDSVGSIRIELNLFTDDQHRTPVVHGLRIGSVRTFDSSGGGNGWQIPAGMQSMGTTMNNTGGAALTLTAPFVASTAPIGSISIGGSTSSGVTFQAIDAAGNSVGNAGLNGLISFSTPQPGFGMTVQVPAGGWLGDLNLTGQFVQPAQNPTVDVTADGSIDWSFPESDAYGLFGWQQLLSAGGVAEDTAHSVTIVTNGSGLSGAGTQSMTLLNAVTWNGTHSFDRLEILCGFSSCGSITANGTLEIIANEIVVGQGTSIIANGVSTGGNGSGSDVASPSGGCCGGGGAGHGAAGGAGGGSNGGNAGIAYGDANETGSSGGDITSTNVYSASGGGGGGFIHIVANMIWINGTLQAHGADGTGGAAPATGTGPGGPGAGGGSGGSIHLEATSIMLGNGNQIDAHGGDGGNGANGQQNGIGIGMYDGGDGGGGGAGGRILLGDAQNNPTLLLLSMNGDTRAGNGGGAGSAYGTGSAGSNGNSGSSGSMQAYTHSGFSRSTSADIEVLIPADATLMNGLITIAPLGETFTTDVDVEIAGVSLGTVANGSAASDVLLTAAALQAIAQTAGSHTDPQTGRSWREITLTLDVSESQTVRLTSATFGYELIDNVTGITTQLSDYHAAVIGSNPPPTVTIPTTVRADAGAVSIAGGVYHELIITNLPFTPPTTLYPDGELVHITTSHHHLTDNTQIDSIVLRGDGSDGSQIEFVLDATSDLSSATFSQTGGAVQVRLVPSASSVSEMPGANGFTDLVVDWTFEVLWNWDDVATIDWMVNALDAQGEGIAPAYAQSGGLGAQAVENDLEIDGFVVMDSFGRTLSNPFSPDYPLPVRAGSTVHVEGSVRFQNTAGRRPAMDAFSAGIELDGQSIAMNATEAGIFSGLVQLPAATGVIDVTTLLPRVGPANGSTGAEDSTFLHPMYEMVPDSMAPSTSLLQVTTSFGLLDANGFVWDPSSPLVVHATIGDDLARAEHVTLRYWREAIDDDDHDGEPDPDEYDSVQASLSDGQPGDQQVTFPPIQVSQLAFNDRVSLFVEGTDWAGLTYQEGGTGGAPGFMADWATLFIASNEPTTLLAEGLDLDSVEGYLLAGQMHTLSMEISDRNGVTTLDEIEVKLCGENLAPLGVFTYDPRQDVLETANGSHLFVSAARISAVDEEVSRVEIDFIVLWSWPMPDANASICQPGIEIVDDEEVVQNVNHIGELAWTIDNRLSAIPTLVEDLTPPVTDPSGISIAVRQGDEIAISGQVVYAGSGAILESIPDGLRVSASVMFSDSSIIEAANEVASDSSFEVPLVLPSRTPLTPTVPVTLIVLDVPGEGMSEVDESVELVVDSTSPQIVFDASRYPTGSLTLLESDRLHEVRVQVVVEDDGGMPDGDLEVHWVYLRNGLPIPGSGGDDTIRRTSTDGADHLHEGSFDMSPAAGTALAEGDQIAIWFVASDRAGNQLVGTGTEDSPRVPTLRLIEFVPVLDSIESSPRFPHVGQLVRIDVTMDNLGLRPGNITALVAERLADGTWVAGDSREFMFGPGDTGVTHTFQWEAWTDGEPDLHLVIDGDFDRTERISGIQVQSVSEGAAGSLSSTAVLGGIALVVMTVIAITVILVLQRKGEDEWEEEAEWVEEALVTGTPPPPPAEHVSEEVAEALTMLPDDWNAARIEQYRAGGWSIAQIVSNHSTATAPEPPTAEQASEESSEPESEAAPARLKGSAEPVADSNDA